MLAGTNWVGKANKPHECRSESCSIGDIIVGEIFCRIMFKSKRGWFSYSLHLECLQDFIGQRYQARLAWIKENRMSPVKKTLEGVTDEAKLTRRRKLQYIIRHKKLAFDALARNDGFHYELHVRNIMVLSWEISNEVTPGVRVTSALYHRLPQELPYWEEIKARTQVGSIDELPWFKLVSPQDPVIDKHKLLPLPPYESYD